MAMSNITPLRIGMSLHRGAIMRAKVADAMTILDPVAETRERLAVATLRWRAGGAFDLLWAPFRHRSRAPREGWTILRVWWNGGMWVGRMFWGWRGQLPAFCCLFHCERWWIDKLERRRLLCFLPRQILVSPRMFKRRSWNVQNLPQHKTTTARRSSGSVSECMLFRTYFPTNRNTWIDVECEAKAIAALRRVHISVQWVIG